MKNYDILIFGRNFSGPPPAPSPAPLIPGDRTVYPGLSIYAETVPEAGRQERSVYYLKRELAELKLEVRSRRPGDRVTLLGKPGGRSLSRLFIDQKIPKEQRDALPVLTAGGEVVAVYPLGPSARHIAEPGEAALRIQITE